MVKGKIYNNISVGELYKKITPFDIYQFYVGKFPPNDAFCNPFRDDRDASFLIGTKTGNWRHFDFADEKWRGGAIDLVQQIHNCSFTEALERIQKDFRLGENKQREVIKWETPKVVQFHPPTIKIITRRMNKEELEYWNSYHLDIEDLKKADVYSPDKIYRNGKRLNSFPLTFCYWYKDIQRWKIYRPFAPVQDKNTPVHQIKWDSSVPFDYCDNLHFSGCRYGFLNKSRKDRIVTAKVLGTDCVADVQAESPHCLNENTVKYFKENCEVPVVVFDADGPGKKASKWITKEYGWKHINVPDGYLKEGITDFADLAKAKGLEAVYKHFKKKGYI